jgi:hypothetical protein
MLVKHHEEPQPATHETPSGNRAGEALGSPETFFVDAKLPLTISPKWVAYACRMSGLSKPRWNRSSSEWTTTTLPVAPQTQGLGPQEKISVSRGKDPKSIRLKVECLVPSNVPSETAARRLVTTIVMGMQWSLRQQRLSVSKSR